MGAVYKVRNGDWAEAHQFFDKDDSRHINVRELMAAFYGLRASPTTSTGGTAKS